MIQVYVLNFDMILWLWHDIGLRIALLQLLARERTANILQKAEQYISEAANNGAKLAILPVKCLDHSFS